MVIISIIFNVRLFCQILSANLEDHLNCLKWSCVIVPKLTSPQFTENTSMRRKVKSVKEVWFVVNSKLPIPALHHPFPSSLLISSWPFSPTLIPLLPFLHFILVCNCIVFPKVLFLGSVVEHASILVECRLVAPAQQCTWHSRAKSYRKVCQGIFYKFYSYCSHTLKVNKKSCWQVFQNDTMLL